ncbi:MAG: AAA family ATPase [Spirochaetia bacterium]|nr:AAA family ATPase [Spirochaetia bacterium]
MLRRRIEKDLAEWYDREERKPLILRGARQVGKTTAIEKFAENFTQFIYLNLEKRDDRDIFSQDLPFQKLLEGIFFLKDADLQEESTLLCIDEIQNSPEAIAYLRFFYEEAPELPVVCAGSLLEVYIDSYSVSFPVGRVEYLYIFPLDFEEYLDNLDTTKPLEAYRKLPVPPYAHTTLMEYFHEYSMIGGMPEVCAHYRTHGDVRRLERIYEGLLTSYIDDAAKYSSSPSSYQSLRHVIESAANETGTRIKFQGFGNSNYRSREMGEALRHLKRAMFLYLLYPSTDTCVPALPRPKESPRLQIIDIQTIELFRRAAGH